MRRIVRFTAVALVAAFACASGPARAQALDPKFDPRKLQIPALRPIPKVAPERWVMKNGLVVYLLENHDLPVVQGALYVRASSTWAPKEKTGLGAITGTVMRSGGSAKIPGDALDDRLGAIGASISTALGPDFGSGNFRALAENAAEVIGHFAEIVQRPAFPDDKIELAKVAARREIAQRNDEMMSVLQRVATQAVYGKDSPWARTPEYATIEAIRRDDLVAMHRLAFAPNRAFLVVYGDFRTADMKKTLTAAFGGWARSDEKTPELPPMPALGSPRLVFAPKNDVTQSGVVLAHLGFRADDPDYPAMDVLEYALGGGFNSRLFNTIRTQRGLAYAAGAQAGSGFFRPGVFLAFSLTRNDSVMVALDLLRRETEAVVRAPLADEETKNARDAVQNAFVFQFENPAQVAFRAAFYELAGYPADFLQTYQRRLAEVTPQVVHEAARRKIRPEHLITVIVGKEAEFDRPLESAGLPVERVDISIPPPPSKLAIGEATPEALAEGGRWLARAAELAGGPAAWAALTSWSEEAQATLSMQGQTMGIGTVMQYAFPNRMRQTLKLPFGEVVQAFDGTNGWSSQMGQIKDQPDMAAEVARDFERSLFRLFARPGEYRVQALPEPRQVDGVSYRVAVVRSEAVRDWQLYFDSEGRLARMEYMDKGPNGDGLFTLVLSDWRPVGGVRYPHVLKTLVGGEPFMESKITAAQANPTLGDDVFRKPAN
uniref:Insulinase family protein n=1 Tax=Eiseniibacteriota bacterium TaxID=2212470 RepID=A0A832I1Z9_UNCEI